MPTRAQTLDQLERWLRAFYQVCALDVIYKDWNRLIYWMVFYKSPLFFMAPTLGEFLASN